MYEAGGASFKQSNGQSVKSLGGDEVSCYLHHWMINLFSAENSLQQGKNGSGQSN